MRAHIAPFQDMRHLNHRRDDSLQIYNSTGNKKQKIMRMQPHMSLDPHAKATAHIRLGTSIYFLGDRRDLKTATVTMHT